MGKSKSKVKLSDVEVKFTEYDVELFDYVVDDILDGINAIRNEISESGEFEPGDILDYLDKLCELLIQLADDHKLYVIFTNQTMSVVKQLAKMILNGGSKTEISKEDKIKLASMFS